MRVKGLAVAALAFGLMGAAEPVRNIDYFQISEIDTRQGLDAVLDRINLTENSNLGSGGRLYKGTEGKTGHTVILLTENDKIVKVIYRFSVQINVRDTDQVAAVQSRYALDKLPGAVIEKDVKDGRHALFMRFNCDDQPAYQAACSIRFSYLDAQGLVSNEMTWLNRPLLEEAAKKRQTDFEKKLP
ncbi:hypothetical protein [Rhizobium bangladeshense]|uniref:hypothetical protein n=1 Tax=Rhizobium bangladeshense TaxID=1138189 RepID=UPI0007E59BB0|nr:hypothetical protein [Rhizobium bangladeshense]